VIAVSANSLVPPLFLAVVVLVVALLVQRDNRQHQRSRDDARKISDHQEHIRWSRAGFSYEEECQWRRWISDPGMATRYRNEGKSPAEAGEIELERREIEQWVQGDYQGHRGFTREQTKRWRDAGYNLHEARRVSHETGDYDSPPPLR
jgi:hypothetical protein